MMTITNEEKKIILRRKPLPKYYISIKSLFPSVYLFIKRDLLKLIKPEDFENDVIYDYKNDDFWISVNFFNKTEQIYVGYVQNETFDSYKTTINESSAITGQLYNQYILVRCLKFKELLAYKHKFKKEKDYNHKVISDYCKYEIVSRIFIVKLINRLIFCFKYIPRYKYQQTGKKIILKKCN